MTAINGLTEIERIYELQSRRLKTVDRTTLYERKAKLQLLLNKIYDSKETIFEALKSDLGKSFTESQLNEIYPVVSEIKHALRNLRRWMNPQKVATPITMLGSRSKIIFEPKGRALIISPWNYPFLLSVSPLISAIAGGNLAIIKPSEKSKATSQVIKKIVNEVFLEEEVAVILGDHSVGQALLELNFDHIFYTGSTFFGKEVMKAAANHLSSLTLELGGKSPGIIDGTYDLEITAERIAWGKFMNAGQTCIAPDYIVIKQDCLDHFMAALKEKIMKFYSEEGRFDKGSAYARIINEDRVDRLNELILREEEAGGKVVLGGGSKIEEKFIEPTIIVGARLGGPIMTGEIFGPILPILTYNNFDDIVSIVAANPNPLAMYLFSNDKKFVNKTIEKIPSGGVTVNGVLLHFANVQLPFGGIKGSGIGKGHGYSGFREFTNARAVLKQSKITPISLMYPPHTKFKQKLADLITKYL